MHECVFAQAPEIIGGIGTYAPSCIDIWSCGVILWVVMCGEFPFREATINCPIFAAMIENDQWPDMQATEWFSSELRELFRGAA